MKEEDIEKAAREESGKWVPSPIHLQDIYRRDDFEVGFHTGAEWRINSMWHDADDKPDENPQNKRLILIEHKADGDSTELSYSLIYSHTYAYFCVIRWAYIGDLIPNKED